MYNYFIEYLDKYTGRKHKTTVTASSVKCASEKFYEWHSFKFYEIVSIIRGEEVSEMKKN